MEEQMRMIEECGPEIILRDWLKKHLKPKLIDWFWKLMEVVSGLELESKFLISDFRKYYLKILIVCPADNILFSYFVRRTEKKSTEIQNIGILSKTF